MNEIINVKVPYNVSKAYTLYVLGMKVEKPFLDENGEYYTFSFLNKTVFVLFYTFSTFRRCCIVTGWDERLGLEPVCLPGVDKSLCLLYETRGRKLDELKRVLYLLTQDNEYEVFTFDTIFWFHLIALIEGSGGQRWEVEKLFLEYKREHKNGK